jgi:diadenosine tetraphosphatase ApaH/serine/threonine PP2A family protein phosphatase
MRVALLSDIHANLPALEAVEKDLDSQAVDRVLSLGDVLGYGPYPNECVDWLRERGASCLAGNHDLALLEWLDASTYHPDALSALIWQRGVLRAENRRWLATLENKLSLDGFEAMHGVPPRPLDFEYLLGLDGARRMIARFSSLATTTFIGHSHLTKCFVVRPAGFHELMAERLKVCSEARLIVTVGSVGQPRDNNPKAAWVLFDTETRDVCFRRVSYPVRKTAQAIRARRLPAFLAERLYHGI